MCGLILLQRWDMQPVSKKQKEEKQENLHWSSVDVYVPWHFTACFFFDHTEEGKSTESKKYSQPPDIIIMKDQLATQKRRTEDDVLLFMHVDLTE